MLSTMVEPLASLWNDANAPSDPVDLLVYASNLLGADPTVTNFGGGNTSVKVRSRNPLTGDEQTVLWVKASGGDLGSATRARFASLNNDWVVGLESRHQEGIHEDDLVPLYAQCTVGGNPAAPSIDTPLHALVPFPCVSHLHPDAVIAIAASADAERLTQEIFQGRLGFLPWKRPGYELGMMLRDLIRDNPNIVGAMMGGHGFICWADDWKSAYELSLDLIRQADAFIKLKSASPFGENVCDAFSNSADWLAEHLPEIRGRVAWAGKRVIGFVDQSADAVDFSRRARMPELAGMGTSCPDHFLRTKICPMVLDPCIGKTADEFVQGLDKALAQYREHYSAYYLRNAKPDSPAMRNPNPSVVIIPGIGMVGFGPNPQEARLATEFFGNAIRVMRGAETVSRYVALPECEAFGIEYWSLEEAKLKRMPPEKEMARRVVVIAGAGPGIGQHTARKFLDAGACVLGIDLNAELAEDFAEGLAKEYGAERVKSAVADITCESSFSAAMRVAISAWGGVDALVINAAVFLPPESGLWNSPEQWKKSLEINVLGSLLPAKAALDLMRKQGTGGAIVLTGSANAVVPKIGSMAYDVSKAALNHLVRELAIAGAPDVRVNAVAPATVLAGSQMFSRERVISSLNKYGIEFSESDSTALLQQKLGGFYAQRTMLKREVTPDAVAEATYLLASDHMAHTTGHIIPVDGGLAEAFLR